MDNTEEQDGAAQPGDHAGAAQDTIVIAEDQEAEGGVSSRSAARATVFPQPAAQIARIVQELGEKAAAAAEAAAQGSAGGGSEQASAAQGEEGIIARGTHLATGDKVGTVRSKAGKKEKKDNVRITEMARRVHKWGIESPSRAAHSVWKWAFKYKTPPAGASGHHLEALCSLCCVRLCLVDLCVVCVCTCQNYVVRSNSWQFRPWTLSLRAHTASRCRFADCLTAALHHASGMAARSLICSGSRCTTSSGTTARS